MSRTFLLALVALGCHRGGEEDLAYCAETATAVELSAETPLGFTAQSVADLATSGAPWAPTLTWERGGTTPLAIGFGAPTAARFVASEPEYPEDGMDLAIVCFDRVEVDLPATFATDDGAFDEAWDVTLWRLEEVDPPAARTFVEFDPFALTGTYDVTLDAAETEYETMTLFLDGTFDGTATTGTLTVQVTGEEECEGNECTAWAAEHDVATWQTGS